MIRILSIALTAGSLLALCGCGAEQPQPPAPTGDEEPGPQTKKQPTAEKPGTPKRDKGPIESGDAKSVAFAVAWCTNADPAAAAKTATAEAIKTLGCPPKGLIFYEYFPKTVKVTVKKDTGEGEEAGKEEPAPEKKEDVPDREKEEEMPGPEKKEDVPAQENEGEVPVPDKEEEVPNGEKDQEVPIPEKEEEAPDLDTEKEVPDLDKEKKVLPAIRGVAESVPVIGCRARSLVTGGTMLSDTVAVLAVGGNDISCKAVKAKLEVERKAVGNSIAKQLGDVKDLKLVMALSEMNLSFDTTEGVSVEDFIRGVLETAGKDVTLFGGNCMPNDPAAGDLGGVQFIDDETLSGHVVAIGIGGPIAVHANHTNEFTPSEETLTVTKAEDKWVYEFDGQPAPEVYRKIRGMKADQQFTIDWQHPIGVVVAEDKVYLRMVLGEDQQKQGLQFVAAVPVGTKVKILKGGADPQAILDSAREGITESLQKAGESKPLLALLSDCCARGMRLREFRQADECEIRQAILPAIKGKGEFPIFGFYAWGELGPIAGEFGGLNCMYQQHTFVSAVLTEEIGTAN